MLKGYVKIDGVWHKVYETNDWWDVLCWVTIVLLVVTLVVATIGIQVWEQ